MREIAAALGCHYATVSRRLGFIRGARAVGSQDLTPALVKTVSAARGSARCEPLRVATASTLVRYAGGASTLTSRIGKSRVLSVNKIAP